MSADERCLLLGEDCELSSHEDCNEIFRKYCKVVFCKDDRCAWNVALGEDRRKQIKHHKADKPFPKDAYRGVCGRPELGLSETRVDTAVRKYVLATCDVRSDKFISGHMDFSKLPQHGLVPDPVTPDAAYH